MPRPTRKTSAPARRGDSPPGEPARGERLQKVLAAAGLGSRRACEQLIEEGRVEVDRRVQSQLGVRVDAEKQEIRVDGTPLPKAKRVYFVINKPRGVVCTNSDPQGRPRVVDLIGGTQRLFTVGRLDRMSDGLLLVTNDGELANRLTHPRYGVEKTYRVVVAGNPPPEALRQLRQGVQLAEGLARVVSVRVKRRRRNCTELEIVLDEGRNREIRRILARAGHKVQQLTRIAVGSIRLGDLPSGAYRPLSRDEIRRIKQWDRRKSPSGKQPRAGKAASPRAAQQAGDSESKTSRPRRKPGRPAAASSKTRTGRKPAQRGAAGARGASTNKGGRR